MLRSRIHSTPVQMNVAHGSRFRFGSWVHFIAIFVLLSVNEGRSAAAGAANPVQALDPTPQALIDAWQVNRSGGIAVALIAGDKVVYHCVGQFSAKDPRTITPDTLFEIGSITKAFTAILLADAVERGEIRLDDPIGEPFAKSAITYRQLATHTSGLPRMGPGIFFKEADNPLADETLARLCTSFATAASTAKPSRPLYSNFGFAVLGQAVAFAAKDTWASAMKSRVLAPLGLRDMWLSVSEADHERLAPGHSEGRRVPHWDFDAYAPAGAIVSSARELSRLASAMLGALDTSVKPALARSMTRVVWEDEPRTAFGLAWLLELRAGRQLVSHAGVTLGFQAFIGINAEKNLGVVVLSNDVSPIEPLAYALLNGKKLPVRRQEQPEVRLTIQELDSYVGHYQLAPSLVIEVRRDEDMLVVQLTGQESKRVYAEAKDRFFYRAIKAQYTFERDSTGVVTAVVLRQNGRDLRAPRI